MGCGALDWIDTNRHDTNAAFLKIRQPLLKTPQLGVTKWSPMTAVKNHDRTVGRKQIGQCDLFPGFVGQ